MKLATALVLSLVLISSQGLASDLELSNYNDILNQVKSSTNTPAKTLVIFDIDNTLLKMNQDFGSEPWFEWQAGQIATNATELRAAKDFPELIRVQEVALSLNEMSLTDTAIPKTFEELAKTEHPLMVLTSRGPGDRINTLRELNRHNLVFTNAPRVEINADFYSQLQTAGFKKVKPIEYTNGVFLTEGQHKGTILLTLLKNMKEVPERVIYIDNLERQNAKVEEALRPVEAQMGFKLTTIRYSGADQIKADFDNSPERKAEAYNSWMKLKGLSSSLFPKTAQ